MKGREGVTGIAFRTWNSKKAEASRITYEGGGGDDNLPCILIEGCLCFEGRTGTSALGANCTEERLPSVAVAAPANDILGLATIAPASSPCGTSSSGNVCLDIDALRRLGAEELGEVLGDGDGERGIAALSIVFHDRLLLGVLRHTFGSTPRNSERLR